MTEKQFGVGLLNQETFGKQIREMFWVRLSLHTSQVAHQAEAYPGFLSMKRLRVFLLPPGWDAGPWQSYPPALNLALLIYTPGWREAL